MKMTLQKGHTETIVAKISVTHTAIRSPSIRGHKESTIEAPLNNSELFIRDNYTCMYCGDRCIPSKLSRDYIQPFVRHGQSVWTNVVTACQTCNRKKAGKSVTNAGMSLLAVPYAPSRAEQRILAGRNIIADQMNFVGCSKKNSNQRVVVEKRQRGNCYA